MKGNECLDTTVLQEFLGVDGIHELKSKVIDVIVEQVRDDIRNEWIIGPDDVSYEISKEVIEDVVEEIKEEYKEKVKEAVEKKLSESGFQL